ncbi:hypothetical protein J4458_05945 [Candidatus Woesearchaeota archaeon]|nr:hypothetical protein [Candidatus Woesearchaeota archaeon]
MDRYLEEQVEALWQSLSPQLQAEIQLNMRFRREDVSAEQLTELVLGYVGPKLMELRTERRITEQTQRIRDEVMQETRAYLGGLGQASATYFEEIAARLREMDGQILYHLEGLKPQKALLPASTERYIPPQATALPIHVNTPIKMKCTYREGGPENVISERQEEDGVYRRCTIAEQIRERRILPHLLTTVYKQTGCPSNPLVWFRCKYIEHERIKVR